MADLAPYQPSAARPWNRKAASHLLRRAGFAPAESETRDAMRLGVEATVRRLVETSSDGGRHDELDELGETLATRNNIAALRGWWLLRMCHTERPLHARMALLWHDHFATSYTKVRSATMMLRQLREFERLGTGGFEELLLAVSRDPAMIVWLDGNDNVKGRPNENYARELFELFSLGVGNYTEQDIKEAARAFTGWHQRNGRFQFARHSHDDADKTVFSRRGPLGGEDVVKAVLDHEACAPFLATRLLEEFVCPRPPRTLVDAVAARLRQTRYDVGDAVRAILASEAMFDPQWHRARIKSPVEFVVGIARSLEMRVPAGALADATGQMGQRLFEPPSVKGWDGHRAWVNSATMLVRLNTAVRAASAEENLFDPAAVAQRYGVTGTDEAVDFCRNLTLDGDVPDAIDRELRAIDADRDAAMRRALEVLLTSPEYNMA